MVKKLWLIDALGNHYCQHMLLPLISWFLVKCVCIHHLPCLGSRRRHAPLSNCFFEHGEEIYRLTLDEGGKKTCIIFDAYSGNFCGMPSQLYFPYHLFLCFLQNAPLTEGQKAGVAALAQTFAERPIPSHVSLFLM